MPVFQFPPRYPDSPGRGEHYHIMLDNVDLGSILNPHVAGSTYGLYVLCADTVLRRLPGLDCTSLDQAQSTAAQYFATQA